MKKILSFIFIFYFFSISCALAKHLKILSIPEIDLLFESIYGDGALTIKALSFSNLESANINFSSQDLSCNDSICTGTFLGEDISLSFLSQDNILRVHILTETGEVEILTIKVEQQSTIVFNPDSLSFGEIFVGRQNCKNVTIINQGAVVFIPNITESIFPDPPFYIDPYTCQNIIQGLMPGEQCIFRTCFKPILAGTYQSRLILRGNGSEATLFLSGKAISPPSTGADLTIEITEASTSVYNNQPFPITIKVKNIGTGTANNFRIGFYIYPATNPLAQQEVFPEEGDTYFSNLMPGQHEEREYIFKFKNLQVHENYSLLIVVDPDNYVNEKNEENNKTIHVITVLR